MNLKIKENINNLVSAKKQLIKSLIQEETLTKIEKLDLIKEYNLFELDGYICDPFKEKYEQDFINELKSEMIEDKFFIVDSIIDDSDYDRHQTVYFTDIIQDLIYSLEDATNLNEEVKVLSCRGVKDTLNKSVNELIDVVFEYAITNNTIGFVFDW